MKKNYKYLLQMQEPVAKNIVTGSVCLFFVVENSFYPLFCGV